MKQVNPFWVLAICKMSTTSTLSTIMLGHFIQQFSWYTTRRKVNFRDFIKALEDINKFGYVDVHGRIIVSLFGEAEGMHLSYKNVCCNIMVLVSSFVIESVVTSPLPIPWLIIKDLPSTWVLAVIKIHLAFYLGIGSNKDSPKENSLNIEHGALKSCSCATGVALFVVMLMNKTEMVTASCNCEAFKYTWPILLKLCCYGVFYNTTCYHIRMQDWCKIMEFCCQIVLTNCQWWSMLSCKNVFMHVMCTEL